MHVAFAPPLAARDDDLPARRDVDAGAVPRFTNDEWARGLRAAAPTTDRVVLALERVPWCDIYNNLKSPQTHHCTAPCPPLRNRRDEELHT